MRNQGMMAAVAKAAGLNEEAAADLTIDAAFLSANFPDLVAGFRAEGAKAERERIAAIDEAALPGHEALVAKAKAEGMTAADLALAIVAAVKTNCANGADSEAPQDHKPALAGEALWKSEFASSEDLQAEFGSEANYLAFKRADARGGIKLMSKRNA